MQDWQRSFQAYAAAYDAYTTRLNSWTPSDGTIEEALSQAVDGIDTTLNHLDEMEDAYQRVLSLADRLLEQGEVPEIVSGQVSKSDVRRYFVVAGNYIDYSRKGLLASKECYRKAPRQRFSVLWSTRRVRRPLKLSPTSWSSTICSSNSSGST